MIFGWFSLQALQEKEIVKFSTPRNCYFLAENSSCILLDRLSYIKHLTEFLNRPYPRFVFFFKTTNYFQRRLASMALCSQLCVCRHIYCLLFILLRVFYYGFYCSFCCFFCCLIDVRRLIDVSGGCRAKCHGAHKHKSILFQLN